MEINTSWYRHIYHSSIKGLQGDQEYDDMLKFVQALTLNPTHKVIYLTGL
jgi:hypothetical protein